MTGGHRHRRDSPATGFQRGENGEKDRFAAVAPEPAKPPTPEPQAAPLSLSWLPPPIAYTLGGNDYGLVGFW